MWATGNGSIVCTIPNIYNNLKLLPEAFGSMYVGSTTYQKLKICVESKII